MNEARVPFNENSRVVVKNNIWVAFRKYLHKVFLNPFKK